MSNDGLIIEYMDLSHIHLAVQVANFEKVTFLFNINTKHKSYVHNWDWDFLSCKTYMTPILRPTRLHRLLARSGSVITTDILLLLP